MQYLRFSSCETKTYNITVIFCNCCNVTHYNVIQDCSHQEGWVECELLWMGPLFAIAATFLIKYLVEWVVLRNNKWNLCTKNKVTTYSFIVFARDSTLLCARSRVRLVIVTLIDSIQTLSESKATTNQTGQITELLINLYLPILWASSNTTTADLGNPFDTKSAILGSSK